MKLNEELSSVPGICRQRPPDGRRAGEAGGLRRVGQEPRDEPAARHLHRDALLDGAGGRLLRDLQRSGQSVSPVKSSFSERQMKFGILSSRWRFT